MNTLLQLVLLVLTIGSGCQVQSEEKELGFEDIFEYFGHQMEQQNNQVQTEIKELKELILDQNRNNKLETEVRELKEVLKNEDRNSDMKAEIKELKQIQENQNGNSHLNTALEKLEEIRENQNNLKSTLENRNNPLPTSVHLSKFDQMESKMAQLKQMVENQNIKLQKLLNGHRNLKIQGKTIEVLYDQNGWIVIQSRFNGWENFFRGWNDYRNGFGDLDGEFWLGLENIHLLTTAKDHELLIQMEDFNGVWKFARYKKFAIAGETSSYKLTTLKSYSGTAGDSLDGHLGYKFSTHDRDNDPSDRTNCAKSYNGAWWYEKCHNSHLNGLYGNRVDGNSMHWYKFNDDKRGLKTSKMMIREV